MSALSESMLERHFIFHQHLFVISSQFLCSNAIQLQFQFRSLFTDHSSGRYRAIDRVYVCLYSGNNVRTKRHLVQILQKVRSP